MIKSKCRSAQKSLERKKYLNIHSSGYGKKKNIFPVAPSKLDAYDIEVRNVNIVSMDIVQSTTFGGNKARKITP